tara:strand:- start:13 stop:435 length:423 start_codon:yes stop_codon:yes gene_type:complete
MQYYWDDTSHINVLERYTTIWKGTLINTNVDSNWVKPEQIREFDDLLVDVCERNFEINLDESNIYLSLCQDSPYYYHEFEKNILKFLRKSEKKFNININEGEFYCWECRPLANSYRYRIYKKDNKFKLKKSVLNWEKDVN